MISSRLKKISVQDKLSFTKSLSQTNIEGQSGLTYPIFPVPFRNSKETDEIEYDLKSPLVAYHYNASNSCCFVSLAYALNNSAEKNATRSITM